jgi:hypothetical protein
MATPRSRPPDGVKRVLLQKENLQTFDKTWLPARLQPPKLEPGTPYAVYLSEYESYLFALQHMKAVHLRCTARDPSRAPAVSIRRAHALVLGPKVRQLFEEGLTGQGSPDFAMAQQMLTSPDSYVFTRKALSFGELSPADLVALPSLGGSAPSTSGWKTVSEASRTPSQTPYASSVDLPRSARPASQGPLPSVPATAPAQEVEAPVVADGGKKARKAAARRRQRAARAARQKLRDLADANVSAALAKARVTAAKAEDAWTKVERRSRKRTKPSVKAAPATGSVAAVSANHPLNRKARRAAIYGGSGGVKVPNSE